jgi:hypothetical protein
MTSRDRSRRNRRAPDAFHVVGDGPLARLLAERLPGGVPTDPDVVRVVVGWEPGEGVDPRARIPADDPLADAERDGANRVVVVSSGLVLGAGSGLPIPEDSPPTDPDGDGAVDRLRRLEAEVALRQAARTRPQVHLLRPAVVVGPDLDTPFVRHFAAPRLLSVRGSPVAWQFCHVDDLAAAIRTVVEAEVAVASVGAPGFLDGLDVTRITRRRRLELPESALLAAADRLHRVGVAPLPASTMRFLVRPWPLEVTVLPAAGWAATTDNEGALRELLEVAQDRIGVAGRLVTKGDAGAAGAAGAAGVTVAALGAAVLVRRARRRGRRASGYS